MPTFDTPMMQQYMRIKKQYPDCILFFRLGDFYEMFLDDAKIGAHVLDITLTARSRGKDGKIPMAGVPFHAVDSYLSKMVRAGYKVAICEQLSDPNNPGLVERGVVRVVTPGTVLDNRSLSSGENNYIAAISIKNKVVGMAFADISTGFFASSEVKFTDLAKTLNDELSKYNPKEILLTKDTYEQEDVLKILHKLRDTNVSSFDHKPNPTKHLKDHFGVASLAGLGLDKKSQAIQAASVLLNYFEYTQTEKAKHITSIQDSHDEKSVFLGDSTIRSLEILTTLRDGEKRGSLVDALDDTQTAMGSRMLKNWLFAPLTSKTKIEKRLDQVEHFYKNKKERESIRQHLSEIADVERLLSRINLNLGSPRDMESLKNSLITASRIKQIEIGKNLQNLIKEIENTIQDDPPVDPKQGGLIKEGVNKKLDDLKKLMAGSKDWIAELEATQKEETQIPSLKVRFNKVFGFYIEVSKSYTDQVPESYERKQTLVNAERFITPELKKHEEIILTAEEESQKIEFEIFNKLVELVSKHTATIQKTAKEISELDCLTNFAHIAELKKYVRPEITNDNQITIAQGRHPVVESLLEVGDFVPNDVELDSKDRQLIILTGPNMAGKSVYIRQVALITLIAQVGSFVPAKSAKIGVVDKIFVRSGAADVITSGLSTFMVEMVETAHILNNATTKSLIVMDEIGRGTSTYDGISIAWAIAQHLVKNQQKSHPKTLFATHYHELTKLADKHPKKIKNMQMAIAHNNDDPVFLYTAVEGGADHSYGIEVAKLAGIPSKVISDAKKVMSKLNNGQD